MNTFTRDRLESNHVILWELRAGIAKQVVEILMNEKERLYWIESGQGAKRCCSNCAHLIDAYDGIPCRCGSSHPTKMGEDGTWAYFVQQEERQLNKKKNSGFIDL